MSSGYFPNVCVHVEVGDLHHLFHGLIFLISSHDFPQPIAVFTMLLMAAVRANRGAHGSCSAHLQLCHPHSLDMTDSLHTGLCKRNRDLCILPVPSLALCPQTQGSVCSPAICEQWGTMGQVWVCWNSNRIQILAGPFHGQDYHSYFSPSSSAELNCSGTSSLMNEIYMFSPLGCWAFCFNILRRLITSVCHHICPYYF